MGSSEQQQTEPELILRGQLQQLDLGTLLSALQLGRQYLTLDLFDAGGEHHGSVSVKSGRVVSASVGDKTGAEAVRQLLDSQEASEFRVRLQPEDAALGIEPVGTIAALSRADYAEPERTRIVQGVLSDSLTLDEVLRVVAFTRQHVIVELSDENGKVLGEVRAKAGKVLSAQAGELVELAAVQELLRAQAGATFVLYSDPQSVEQLHPLGTLADVLARARESTPESKSAPSNGFRKTLPPPLPRPRRYAESSPQARILEGSLDEFELSHVLNVLSTSRQHFELHVRDDAAHTVGVIDVKSGFIVGASAGRLTGLPAARELLGARTGRFVAIRRAESAAEPDQPALASVQELLQPAAAGPSSPDAPADTQTSKGIPVLDGKLGDLDVTSLLRVAAASRQYTGVHIFDKARRPLGSIYVKGGHIVRAKAQEATGVAAVRRLLHSPRDFLFLVQRYPNAPQVTTAVGSIASVLERAGHGTTQPAFVAPSPPPPAAASRHSVAASNSWMGGAVLGAGFVLLGGIATAVVMNAIAPAPAPTATTLSPITTSAPQPLAPPAEAAKAEPAKDAASSGNPAETAAVPAAALSKATIASLQAGLLQLGYETGPVDGVVGPRTTAAIKAFQYAEHLHADGTLSPPTRAVLQRRIGER